MTIHLWTMNHPFIVAHIAWMTWRLRTEKTYGHLWWRLGIQTVAYGTAKFIEFGKRPTKWGLWPSKKAEDQQYNLGLNYKTATCPEGPEHLEETPPSSWMIYSRSSLSGHHVGHHVGLGPPYAVIWTQTVWTSSPDVGTSTEEPQELKSWRKNHPTCSHENRDEHSSVYISVYILYIYIAIL